MFNSFINPFGQSLTNAILPSQTAQLRFYDPITGRETATVTPNDMAMTVSYYNKNGIAVEIRGTSENVKKAECALNGSNGSNGSNGITSNFQQTQQAPTTEFFSLDVDISEMQNTPNSLFNNTSNSLFNNSTQVTTSQVWKFVTNPSNISKALLVGPGLAKPCSGSGVIFIEKNGNTPTILLIRTNRGTYEDMGGELDNTALSAQVSTIQVNAKKEVLEESQNLFIINSVDLERQVDGKKLYVDLPDANNNAFYRCYFVVINGTSTYDVSQFFNQNKLMTANRSGYQTSDWKESVDLKRFSLPLVKNVLDANNSTGGITCNDVNNVSCTIRDRTANCLRALVTNPDLFTTAYNNAINVRYDYDRQMMSLTNGMHKFNL
jgi:hypothetical protein